MTGLAALHALADELDDLAQRSNAPASAFWPAQSAWFRARPELEPHAVTVYDGDQLVGSAVLARQRQRGVWRVTGAGTPGEPFAMPIASPAVAYRLAHAIHAELRAWSGRWKLRLTDLPVADPVVDALAQLLPETEREHAEDEPCLCFDGQSPVNHYLSRNVRSAVAKARNRVAAAGHGIDLHWWHTPDRIAARIEEIVDVRSARSRQLHRATSSGAELATFTGTIVNQARAGRGRLLEVRIDDQLAAYAMCFLTGGRLWVYSNVVSPDFTRFSAGTIANAEVVRYAHDEPAVRSLSWGRGVQRYKMSGPVTLIGCQALTAWSSPATRQLLTIGRTARQTLNHLKLSS